MSNKITLNKILLQYFLDSGVEHLLGPINKKEKKKHLEARNIEKKNESNLEPSLNISILLRDCNKAEDLKELVVKYCDCALKNTAKKIVFCDGNPQAKVMVIGEAPGEEEDKKGKPFLGEAGILLDKMLMSIGQNRKNTYITNIIFWRPPGNRKPTTEEIEICMPFVKKHIEIINPKILILVGATAAKSIYNIETGITQIRGNWNYVDIGKSENLKSMAIFHPAFLLRQPSRKREAWEDLKKIKIEINKYT